MFSLADSNFYYLSSFMNTGPVHYVITFNVILANQKIASFVYRGLRAMVDVILFSAFVGPSDVI